MRLSTPPQQPEHPQRTLKTRSSPPRPTLQRRWRQQASNSWILFSSCWNFAATNMGSALLMPRLTAPRPIKRHMAMRRPRATWPEIWKARMTWCWNWNCWSACGPATVRSWSMRLRLNRPWEPRSPGPDWRPQFFSSASMNPTASIELQSASPARRAISTPLASYRIVVGKP